MRRSDVFTAQSTSFLGPMDCIILRNCRLHGLNGFISVGLDTFSYKSCDLEVQPGSSREAKSSTVIGHVILVPGLDSLH